MSAAPGHEAVLSREELDALLQTLSEGGGEAGWQPGAHADRADDTHPALATAIERFCAGLSKRLSANHQKRIVFELIRAQRLPKDAAAALALPEDLVAEFEVQGAGKRGALLLSRALFFSFMCSDMGSKPGARPKGHPIRRYTRIEERMYERISREFIEDLGRAWPESLGAGIATGSVLPAQHIQQLDAEELELLTIDVSGFGDELRMRLLLPTTIFEDAPTGAGRVGAQARPRLDHVVHDLPVDVRVELGRIPVTLAELGRLEVGQVLPVEVANPQRLLVRVDGKARFNAIRGAVGERLAVQIVGRVAPTGDEA